MTLLTLLNTTAGTQNVAVSGIATSQAIGKPGTILRPLTTLAAWAAMWEAVPLQGGWLGGDGCWSFTHPTGTSAIFTFGDSPVQSGGNHFPNSTAVIYTNTGLKLVSGTTAWIPNDGDGSWYWAGAMCMEGNTLFVFPSKQDTVGESWGVIGRGLFSFNWSDPDAVPTSPTKIVDLDPAIGWGASVVTISGYHYIFGTWKDSGWFGHSLYLARCAVGSMATGTSAWEFWTTTAGGSWETGAGHLTSTASLKVVVDANESGFTLGTAGLENSFSADLVGSEIKLCSKRAGVYGSDVTIWEASTVTGPYRRRVVAQAPYGVPTAQDQTYLENAHFDLPRLANGKAILSVSHNQEGRATLDYFNNPDERYWPEWFEFAEDMQWVDPTGIASGQAIGSPTVTPGTTTLSPTGIASAGAHGSPTVAPGVTTLNPSSIVTGEAFGTLKTIISATPTGIASAQAIGSPTVTPGSVTTSPTAIPSQQVLGAPTITSLIAPAGIATAESTGSPTVTTLVQVTPGSIASAGGHGSPTVTPGLVTVAPAAVPTQESHGTATVAAGAVTVAPTGVISAESVGQPVFTALVTTSPTAIPSQQALGAPTITALASVTTAPIASVEAIGSPTLTPGVTTLSPTSIGSAESVGQPFIGSGTVVTPGSIASAQGHGAPTVTPGVATVSPTGISSAGALGSPTLTTLVQVAVTGIASSEIFGAPLLERRLEVVEPPSIPSQEALGGPLTTVHVLAGGVGSAETFGTLGAAPGAVALSPVGITTTEGVGAPIVDSGVVVLTPASVGSAEAIGSPVLIPAIAPGGISTAEGLGQPVLTVLPPAEGRNVALAVTLAPQPVSGTLDQERIVGGLALQTRISGSLGQRG